MVSFVNYAGVNLPTTAPYARQFWASGTDAFYGPNTPSMLMGSNLGNFLQGGSADDTIYAIHVGDRMSGGGGVDTAIGTVDFTLPSDVENLTMDARWSHVVGRGNAGANILTAKNAGVTLYGGAGDDVFVAAPDGGGTFVFSPGSGRDVLLDFHHGSDVVRLGGFDLDSFAKVRAAMSQVGADTVLKLSAEDLLVFRNTAVSSFEAQDFQLSIGKAGMALSFAEEFDQLGLQRQGAAGGLATAYDWSGYGTESGHTIKNESQIYVDSTFAGSGSTPLGLNPFRVADGVLTITASQTPGWAKDALWAHDYVSGLITTSGAFAQTYGYFEIRADLPTGKGAFPAFWLLPQDGSYDGEIDVIENVNGGTEMWNHIHYRANPGENWTDEGHSVRVPDLTEGFHTFGVLWTPQTITWFVDGAEVNETATPAALNKPMYMLANFAVGGSWAGAADAAAIAATDMKIDYIRAYSLDNISVAAPPWPVAAAAPEAGKALAPAAPLAVAPTLSVAATAASVGEGADGTAYALFGVTRSGDLSGPTSAVWSVSGTGASAADAADFENGVLPGGTVYFGGGESNKTIWVPIRGDRVSEPNETFSVTLSQAQGATLVTATAQGFIINDDFSQPGVQIQAPLAAPAPGAAATLAIAALNASVVEGQDGVVYARFTVTRSGDLSGPTSATWAVGGSGAYPADAADFEGHVLPGGTVYFGGGESMKQLFIGIAGDTVAEHDETFSVVLSKLAGGDVVVGSSQGFILNNDPPAWDWL